jgi:hypothetical protein
MARPLLEPDVPLEMIERLAAICCTMNEIASVTGLSVDTLERRFAEIIKNGRNIGKASLRREQFRMALSGNPTMLVWLGKQILGQKDKVEISDAIEELDFGGIPGPEDFGKFAEADRSN